LHEEHTTHGIYDVGRDWMFRAEFRLTDFERTIQGLHGFFELIFVAQNLAKLKLPKMREYSMIGFLGMLPFVI